LVSKALSIIQYSLQISHSEIIFPFSICCIIKNRRVFSKGLREIP
jgi:hypothetical protein